MPQHDGGGGDGDGATKVASSNGDFKGIFSGILRSAAIIAAGIGVAAATAPLVRSQHLRDAFTNGRKKSAKDSCDALEAAMKSFQEVVVAISAAVAGKDQGEREKKKKKKKRTRAAATAAAPVAAFLAARHDDEERVNAEDEGEAEEAKPVRPLKQPRRDDALICAVELPLGEAPFEMPTPPNSQQKQPEAPWARVTRHTAAVTTATDAATTAAAAANFATATTTTAGCATNGKSNKFLDTMLAKPGRAFIEELISQFPDEPHGIDDPNRVYLGQVVKYTPSGHPYSFTIRWDDDSKETMNEHEVMKWVVVRVPMELKEEEVESEEEAEGDEEGEDGE